MRRTHGQIAAAIRSRVIKRSRARPDYTTRDVGPLPMDERFWHDIAVMRLRNEKSAEWYAKSLRRNMDRGVC